MDFDLEQILKVFVVGCLALYALLASTIFEVEYPKKFIQLYPHPWWRLLLIVLVILGWRWSPIVGTLLAVVVFFYLHDMFILMHQQN